VPYRLDTRSWYPAPIDEVFAFFASPKNLEALTPAFLRFHVLTPEVEMKRGARFDYRLRLHGVPLRWQSEITVWEPNVRFCDEQRRGPYRYWRHAHHFREERGGTRVEDGVDYDVPGGSLVHRLIVARDLVEIFRYRHERLEETFGPDPINGAKVAILKKL
jgi:ligand-binding SRPBCC domain-containing protein